MPTLKKPKHLSATPISIRHGYPIPGFYEEELKLTAEMEERNIDFFIKIIQSELGGKTVEICDTTPSEPLDGHIYILLDRESISRGVSRQIGGIKRLSKSAESSIMEWAQRRAIEYANFRNL